MKIFKRIIITILFFLIIIYLGLGVFIWTRGKVLLTKRLSQEVGREVRIGSLYLVPPYSININDLEIKNILFVDRVKLEPSIIGLLLGRLGLNKLIVNKPEISIVRLKPNKLNIDEVIDFIEQRQSEKRVGIYTNESRNISSKKAQEVNFFVKEAIIKYGSISFDDKIARISFSISAIDFSVVTELMDFKTRVNLDAKVLSDKDTNLGLIWASGWLNFVKKDMDAKFSLEDVDVSYFSPYFREFLKGAKSGKLLLTAKMISKNNNLVINCQLETRNLSFVDETLIVDVEDKKITLFNNLTGIIFGTLFGPGSAGIFDFSIHTKFDCPRLEGLRFKGNIFKEPIKKIFEGGHKEKIEAVKKVGKDFEAIGKELKEQFKGMKDIFKDFKVKVIKEENEESVSKSIDSQAQEQ